MFLLLMSIWVAAISALILFAVYRSKARMRLRTTSRDDEGHSLIKADQAPQAEQTPLCGGTPK